MSLTPSTMLPLGTTAPDFNLLDTTSDANKTLADIKGLKATVVMFICNHCPYVIHIIDEIINIGNHYNNQGIGFVAISSNNIETHPQDAPEHMKTFAKENGFPFPYLYDESQDTAKAYQAACTPDLYVFDHDLQCVYRGRLDAATPGNGKPVNGEDLRAALDAIIKGEPVTENQIPSQGCNIKWK